MRLSRSWPSAVAILACAGCNTITEGTSQQITVNTIPQGASCVFERQGAPVYTLASTPGTITVQKTKYDLVIKCNKPGYDQAVYLNHSGLGAIGGNIAADLLLTGGISSIVDSATGADNKYEGVVTLTMVPRGGTRSGGAPRPSEYVGTERGR